MINVRSKCSVAVGGVCWRCLCLLVTLVGAGSDAGGGGGGGLRMYNWRRWGPLAADAPLLLVIADGERRPLRALLRSVCAARGVHAALLLVSHARNDTRTQRVVRDIRCCKVAQLVFPHAAADAAAADQCDKVHWWWATRWVFESAPWASSHRGPVMFLRGGGSGQLVAEDALHVLRRAMTLPVHVVSLGRPVTSRRIQPCELVTVSAWRASYSAGLAMSARTWHAVRGHAREYCDTSSASWSVSLERALSAALGRGGALMASVAWPRVVRAADARRLQRARRMFPARMRSVHVWGRTGRVHGALPAGTAGGSEVQSAAAQGLCQQVLLNNHSLA